MLSNKIQIAIIDDDLAILESCQHLLKLAGYQTKTFQDPHIAIQQIHPNWAGVILTDIYMPTMNGLDLIDKVTRISPHIPIITITGHGDIEMAVKAMQKGAVNYLEKPLKPQKLLSLLKTVIAKRQKMIEQWKIIENSLPAQLIGTSEKIEQVRSHIKILATADKNVLIEGEIGTGRYTTARLLHELSPRKNQISIVKTGSSIASVADLEFILKQAQLGSLIIHDPASIPMEVQKALSQYLLEQERTGNQLVKLIVVAGPSSEDNAEKNSLLSELYYFLDQVKLTLPPLREHKEDVILLFRHFLKKSCTLLGKSIPKIDKAYLEKLKQYQWPGNVRELKSVADLYVIGIVKLATPDRVKPIEQLLTPLDDLVEKYEKQLIEDALYLFSGQINCVSDHLQIQRKKLYLRMKKYGIDKSQYKSN